jgi:hypothetical protein
MYIDSIYCSVDFFTLRDCVCLFVCLFVCFSGFYNIDPIFFLAVDEEVSPFLFRESVDPQPSNLSPGDKCCKNKITKERAVTKPTSAESDQCYKKLLNAHKTAR